MCAITLPHRSFDNLSVACSTLLAATTAGFAALTPAIDATLDGTAGLAGTGEGGESLHTTILASAGWSPAENAARSLTWSAYLSALYVEGRGPTARYLGDFFAASNTEAHQSARLYEWWAEAASDAWNIRAGALLADTEFSGTTPGAYLLNSGFGWPAYISGNTLNTGPAYYAAALGARLAFSSSSSTWKIGVYDGDSFDSPDGDDHPNRHGTSYELSSTQGAFIISELALAPSESPQRYLLGAWAHTADFADPDSGEIRQGNYGAYAAIERTLAGTQGETGNLESHLRAGLAPDDRNAVSWAADAALAYTGLLPFRPADTTALGFAYARIHATTPSGHSHEQVWELCHTTSIGEHITLQPDLQYIHRPGGDASLDPALVGTLRLSISY